MALKTAAIAKTPTTPDTMIFIAGDTRIDEDASPDEDSERGDFTYRAWEEAEEGIPVGERTTERIVDVGEHTLSSSDLPRGVAPEKPSTAFSAPPSPKVEPRRTHTLSPDIAAG